MSHYFKEKVLGLLYGSLIGDAAGGPWEFSDPSPRKSPIPLSKPLDPQGLKKLADNFSLDPYQREASAYGPWEDYAVAGALSDDSRFKCLLFQSIEDHGEISREALAKSILKGGSWENKHLEDEWLEEFRYVALWELGRAGGLPPERMWGGKPAIAGQMMLLPLAAFMPQAREDIYLKGWEMSIFDSGMARDFNAALLVGLSACLQPDASWEGVEKAILAVDPFRFGQALYAERRVSHWLKLANSAVSRAEKIPQRLFDILEDELQAESWWECWVPLVVCFSCLKICDYQALAAMELVLLFGHDTDSYLQLMGAYLGAFYGQEIFSSKHISKVDSQLKNRYRSSVEHWWEIIDHYLSMKQGI